MMGEIVCLIKPQFEAGREKVGKKALCVILPFIERVIEKSLICHEYFYGAMSSFLFRIKGPEGNIEYLLHLKKLPEGTKLPDSLKVSVEAVVAEAHGQLD